RLLKEDPNAVPGFALKPGASKETINDPQELFSRFMGIGGTLDQFMHCVKVAKGDLREQVNVATKKVGKALDKTIEDLTEGIVDTKQNQPSIVKVKGKQ